MFRVKNKRNKWLFKDMQKYLHCKHVQKRFRYIPMHFKQARKYSTC